MKNKLIMLFITSSFLIGCGTSTYKKPPYNLPSDDATIKLAQAAHSISDSMKEMARVEKVVITPSADNLSTIPNAENLQAYASVDWSGPVGELTARIARSAHYQLRILGNEPAVPILISLNAKDKTLADILRDIDYQSGQKASIHVYPKSQVIELRYARIYS